MPMRLLLGGLALLLLAQCILGEEEDYYKTMGVSRDATDKQIKKAYKKLAVKYHPDKNRGDPLAHEKFQAVGKAYEVLSDPDERAIYDSLDGEGFQTKWEFERNKRMKGGSGKTADFYRGADVIATLDGSSFRKLVGKNDYYFVEFYAPWCTHCQKMVKEFRKSAILLEDIAKVGAVNCENNKRLCNQYNIRGYPSLVLYPPGNSKQGQMYNGAHTPEAMYSFVHGTVEGQRLTSHLTPATFESQVLGSDDVWLIQFYTPWCGPCNALKPQVYVAASELDGLVKVGFVDCQTYSAFCEAQAISYYPVLKAYPRGAHGGDGQELTMMNQMAAPVLNTFKKSVLITMSSSNKEKEKESWEEDSLLDDDEEYGSA